VPATSIKKAQPRHRKEKKREMKVGTNVHRGLGGLNLDRPRWGNFLNTRAKEGKGGVAAYLLRTQEEEITGLWKANRGRAKTESQNWVKKVSKEITQQGEGGRERNLILQPLKSATRARCKFVGVGERKRILEIEYARTNERAIS